jgi:undecaprenyl-diphosphatase
MFLSQAELVTAVILGAIQGFVEWLPVSSQGTVAAARSLLVDTTLAEAAAFGLWVQLGTTVSVLFVYRRDLWGMLRELFVGRGSNLSPMLVFLVIATTISVMVGLPIYLFLEGTAQVFGGLAMIVIGGLMLVTGATQLRKQQIGVRLRDDLSLKDAALTGIAQGLSVMPGLSRSGLTIATLLARKMDRQEALHLSFLMSLPASLGAALFVGIRTGLISSGEAMVAAGVAAVVGLFTIRGALFLAGKINFGIFVLVIAVLLIASGLWDILR